MRVVLDTCVVVAAVRSNLGASRSVLEKALAATIDLVISAPLIFKYEAVLTRNEHLLASRLTAAEIEALLNLICDVGIEVRWGPRVRPRLVDPNDELVLEAAVNGSAAAIITFNSTHFAGVVDEFQIEVLSPSELLERMKP